MARTDSFFIRAQVLTDGVNYNEAAIDLGAYVDALGKSVLRIHNVQVQYGTAGTYIGARSPDMVSGTQYQLTTQSQTGLVSLNNRSVVSSGSLNYNTDGAGSILSVTETLDAGPQHWTDGYLIAVEQMYLGTDQGTDSLDAVSIVLECTVETMTQAAAMALALSQQ
jgi:hypothetical protein